MYYESAQKRIPSIQTYKSMEEGFCSLRHSDALSNIQVVLLQYFQENN